MLSDSFEHQLRRDSLFNRPYQGPLLPGCQLVANNKSSEIWLVESPKGSEQSAMFPVIGGRLRQCITQFKTKTSTLKFPSYYLPIPYSVNRVSSRSPLLTLVSNTHTYPTSTTDAKFSFVGHINNLNVHRGKISIFYSINRTSASIYRT